MEISLMSYMIECEGFWHDGLPHSCSFSHVGKWGDKELIKHQKEHEKLCDGKTYFWNGFEQAIGYKRERSSSG